MKTALRSIAVLILGATAVAGLILGYLKMRQEVEMEMQSEAPVVAPSRVERGPDGAAILRLDPPTQARLGLQSAPLSAGSAVEEIEATARVLDAAGLAVQLSDLRLAQIALDAARADQDRKQKLFESGRNASASAVEQADAIVRQQEVALQAATDRIAAVWGPSIAARDDLPSLARSLLRREMALVRVDLSPFDTFTNRSPTLRLLHPNGETAARAGVLGPAPSVDAAVVGQSLLCLVDTNASGLTPGSTALARLETGAVEQGFVLPRSAVLRHAGLAWVFVQTGPDTFARRSVPLGRLHPAGWLVAGEWSRPVVVAGAQSLLSEELKGGIQMRD